MVLCAKETRLPQHAVERVIGRCRTNGFWPWVHWSAIVRAVQFEPRSIRLNVDEFLAWMQTEPDSYELIDGEPVRKPDEKQGGRRFGHLVRAAELAMGQQNFWAWLSTKSRELGGTEPFRYVYESWSHLAAALHLLRDPEDGQRLMGDTFRDICDRAERLAAVERQRAMAAVPPTGG